MKKTLLILALLPLPLLMARGGGGGEGGFGGEGSHGGGSGSAETHPAARYDARQAYDNRNNPNYGNYGYSDPYYVPTPPPTTQQSFPQSPESDNFFNDPNWPNVKPGSTYNNNPQ